MDGSGLGKAIFSIGLVVALSGAIIYLLSKFGLSIGKLPGDISIQKERVSFYLPIATSIVLSAVITFIFNLILWLFRKLQ